MPLASALPEPVRVPLTDDEDDPLGDEPNGEPATEQAPAGEGFSREDAGWEVRPWDDPLRDDAATQMNGEDGTGAGADIPAIGETDARPESAEVATQSSFVEHATPAEPEEAAHADAAAIYAPRPEQTKPLEPGDEPVAGDGERGEAADADREPATIALRAAEESVVALEIPTESPREIVEWMTRKRPARAANNGTVNRATSSGRHPATPTPRNSTMATTKATAPMARECPRTSRHWAATRSMRSRRPMRRSGGGATRCGTTRSRRSSNAARSCWCRSPRRSAATRARR